MSQVVKGQITYETNASSYNAADFQIWQAIRRINTAEPVRVVSITPGGVGSAGTVSVQPLVNLVTGTGEGLSQSVLYQLPYLRMQGGANALIVDPKPGDIGLAVYAMRDTETVKANRDGNPANPGSARVYSKGDGFYLGGVLNETPKRYVMVDDEGITMDDGAGGRIELKSGRLTVTAPAGVEVLTSLLSVDDNGGAVAVSLNGNLQINGHLVSSGDQLAGSISQIHHTHTGVEPGSGSSSGPQ